MPYSYVTPNFWALGNFCKHNSLSYFEYSPPPKTLSPGGKMLTKNRELFTTEKHGLSTDCEELDLSVRNLSVLQRKLLLSK